MLRGDKECSQAELAACVGAARGTVNANAIETGKYDSSLRLALKIARFSTKTLEEARKLGSLHFSSGRWSRRNAC